MRDDDFWLFGGLEEDFGRRERSEPRGPRLCSNCNEPGHRRDGCPRLKAKASAARLELIRQRAEARRAKP